MMLWIRLEIILRCKGGGVVGTYINNIVITTPFFFIFDTV